MRVVISGAAGETDRQLIEELAPSHELRLPGSHGNFRD